MVHGSLARTSTNVISPAPANDHDDRFSMSSSRRESRTFLCNQRYSAPSSYRATIGMVAAVCWAASVVGIRKLKQIRLRKMPQNKGVLSIKLFLQSCGIRIIPQCFRSGRETRRLLMMPISSLLKGVTRRVRSRYNQLVMSTVCDAAEKPQFASSLFKFGRVLAALLSVPAALSSELAVTSASQPLR